MISKPSNLDFSGKKFSMIITGPPGVGKTTLALSAPNPLLVDLDRGVSRVAARHRTDTLTASNYEEMLKDLESPEARAYDTIVIDTGGSLITLLQDWAMRQSPANKKKGGGISMQGFGTVKAEFARFSNWLRDVMNKNVVYVFHTQEEKDKDGQPLQRLMCEGSSRNTVWQPCDFGCFVEMRGESRVAGFTPTDSYFAKGCHGISGLIPVPTLDAVKPNDFLAKLFERAKNNIAMDAEYFIAEREAYETAMQTGANIIAGMTDKASSLEAETMLKKIVHALTSRDEIGRYYKDRLKSLGAKWDKEAKRYVWPEESVTNAEPSVVVDMAV